MVCVDGLIGEKGRGEGRRGGGLVVLYRLVWDPFFFIFFSRS